MAAKSARVASGTCLIANLCYSSDRANLKKTAIDIIRDQQRAKQGKDEQEAIASVVDGPVYATDHGSVFPEL